MDSGAFEMAARWNNEKIKAFVKTTLGCGCPEKVFEKIAVSKLLIAEYDKGITRIVVGDTLLIYLIRPELSAHFADSVEAIALAGKNDRDTNQYNRFRLVVSGFDNDVLQGKVSVRYSKSFITDEKMHIHFVDQELVDGLG